MTQRAYPRPGAGASRILRWKSTVPASLNVKCPSAPGSIWPSPPAAYRRRARAARTASDRKRERLLEARSIADHGLQIITFLDGEKHKSFLAALSCVLTRGRESARP